MTLVDTCWLEEEDELDVVAPGLTPENNSH